MDIQKRKRQRLLWVRLGTGVIIIVLAATLWNNGPLLGTAILVVLLLYVTALYLTEVWYSREILRSLSKDDAS